jgi:hypothetical protein
MQMTTRYLNRRSYIEIALLLVVAIAAASFGRWIIPESTGGSSSIGSSAAALPASITNHLTSLKQSQLDNADRIAGFGSVSAAAGDSSFAATHPEREAIIGQANQAGQTDGQSFAAANPERQSILNQARIDAQDRLDGVTAP